MDISYRLQQFLLKWSGSSPARVRYRPLAKRLGVTELPIENERILEVISELDAVAVEALLRKFQIVDDEGVFEEVRESGGSINNLLSYGDFLFDFLKSKELNESIDGLNTEAGFSGHDWNDTYPNGVASQDGEQEFERYHPLYTDGYLAYVLVQPRPHSEFDGTDAAAKELGRQFEREVIGNRYESFSAWKLPSIAWSEWFEGLGFGLDRTLILVDEVEREIWLFMTTDTD